MAKTKYGKYFIGGIIDPKTDRMRIAINDSIIPGSFYFSFNYVLPHALSRSHGPHKHPYGEVIGCIGTDPYNPTELGAEITIYMGEEMEKHTFTTSTLIYIPAELVHCPIVYNKVEKPFIFVYSFPAPNLKETSYKHLVSEEMRKEMIFFDK